MGIFVIQAKETFWWPFGPWRVTRHPRQAHQVGNGTGGGIGVKPGRAWTVPLFAPHHAEGHQTGRRTFEIKYRVNLCWRAERLAELSPHLDSVGLPGRTNCNTRWR
jgi:hypothetical protein